MNQAATQKLQRAKAALIAGDIANAQKTLDSFFRHLAAGKLVESERPALEQALTDLRRIAEASLAGSRAGFEQISQIIESARTLQTYDRGGRRRVATTLPDPATRY